jgi:hypothetical protein
MCGIVVLKACCDLCSHTIMMTFDLTRLTAWRSGLKKSGRGKKDCSVNPDNEAVIKIYFDFGHMCHTLHVFGLLV